jgi:hypothetical protein
MLQLPETGRRRDGIQLRDDPTLLDELYAYLRSPEPLSGCMNCLANAGIERPHIQVRPNKWLSHQEGTTESLLDYKEMARNEAEMHIQRTDHIKELMTYTPGGAERS